MGKNDDILTHLIALNHACAEKEKSGQKITRPACRCYLRNTPLSSRRIASLRRSSEERGFPNPQHTATSSTPHVLYSFIPPETCCGLQARAPPAFSELTPPEFGKPQRSEFRTRRQQTAGP
jgi:hypothetical protein